MSIPSALVLYAIIWFMLLFVILPTSIRSQGESGRIAPGTPPSSPIDPKLGRKIKLVSALALAIWAPVVAVIASGLISMEMIDIFGRWGDGKYG